MLKSLLITIAIAVSQFSLSAQGNYLKPELSVGFSKSTGKKMLNQCARTSPKKKVKGYFNPSKKDFQVLENNFKKILLLDSVNQGKLKDLNSYGYQYLGVIIKDQKYIYINAQTLGKGDENAKFFSPISSCRKAEDGWGVLFNLGETDFSELSINNTKRKN